MKIYSSTNSNVVKTNIETMGAMTCTFKAILFEMIAKKTPPHSKYN